MKDSTRKHKQNVINILEPLTRYSGVSFGSLSELDKEILRILLRSKSSYFEQEIKDFSIHALAPDPLNRQALILGNKNLGLSEKIELKKLADQKVAIYREAAGVRKLNNKLKFLLTLLIRRDEWLNLKQLTTVFNCSISGLKPHVEEFRQVYGLKLDASSKTHYYKLPSEYTELCREEALVS